MVCWVRHGGEPVSLEMNCNEGASTRALSAVQRCAERREFKLETFHFHRLCFIY
jgi:hypothetical protein